MGVQWSQFFPPTPSFTDADVESQEGRVFLITGGTSGIGLELAKLLYRKNGRVYITARSEEKGQQAIRAIQAAVPLGGSGSLEFLQLNLDDLSGIKAAAEAFKSKETKLHVLWNNAGVSQPPVGSVSKQGFELQLATNCLGPFLFTQLLLPLLQETASDAPPASVRVVWASSQSAELSAPPQVLVIDEIRNPPRDRTRNYINSKTGIILLASEFARRAGPSNIVSVSLNPGAASTNLFRHTPWLRYLAWPLLHKPEQAANTQLYAAMSPDITLEKNGCFVAPWGRIWSAMRPDFLDAMKPKEDGGSGRAAEFWDLCQEMTCDYC